MRQHKITFPHVRITVNDQRREFRHHTLAAIYGIKMLRELPTEVLRQACSHGDTFRSIAAQIGRNINPDWVMGQVAVELYRRGAIDGQELDHLTT